MAGLRVGALVAPLSALILGCDPASYKTSAPRSFLLTCSRAGSTAMVLRLDTGVRHFAVVNDAAPDGDLGITRDGYALTTKAWAGKVNRYDGQLVIVQTPGKPNSDPKAVATRNSSEIWSCVMSADKAKF